MAISQHPNATFLSEATTTYNCHAYAWYMTEGGSPIWINNINGSLHVYWLDGSYISTNSTEGTKLYYSNGDHSAVNTSEYNKVISKWGQGPLMKHTPNDCPYDATYKIYYKINDMPDYYIGVDENDYRQRGVTVYTYNGNAQTRLYAYSTTGITPTRYEWSNEFNCSYDRYYFTPSGNHADISVYLGDHDYGGTMRVTCKMYNGSTLLSTTYNYVNIYNGSM